MLPENILNRILVRKMLDMFCLPKRKMGFLWLFLLLTRVTTLFTAHANHSTKSNQGESFKGKVEVYQTHINKLLLNIIIKIYIIYHKKCLQLHIKFLTFMLKYVEEECPLWVLYITTLSCKILTNTRGDNRKRAEHMGWWAYMQVSNVPLIPCGKIYFSMG